MKKRIILILLTLTVLACAGAWMAWRWANRAYHDTAWVYIPQGSTAQAVADSLQARLGDFGSRVNTIYSHARPDSLPLTSGAYLISPGDKAKDVARRLVHRRQTPVKVVINNVRTLPQLAERVASQLDLTAAQFLSACDSLLPASGFRPAEFLAAFLPDTYEFYWTSSAPSTVQRLLDYRNRFWTDERRARAAALGLTPVKVATVASIAEEETASAAERPVVARLYINRLNRGMKLQADPTVKFAVGDFTLRRILAKHLATPSPYNTYLNAGLPPGPIRLAEKATMEATLQSRPHPYLYMCAKEDFSGTHRFTASYAEHQRNAALYRQALNRRGITK